MAKALCVGTGMVPVEGTVWTLDTRTLLKISSRGKEDGIKWEDQNADS